MAMEPKNGKLGRGSKGGIDWYRYQTKILVPKLLPFAQSLGLETLDKKIKRQHSPPP